MTENGKTLFTKRVQGGKNRNYYIDVRESERTGSKYLVVSESRIKEGGWVNHRIVVFSDYLNEWRKSLDEALEHMSPA